MKHPHPRLYGLENCICTFPNVKLAEESLHIPCGYCRGTGKMLMRYDNPEDDIDEETLLKWKQKMKEREKEIEDWRSK